MDQPYAIVTNNTISDIEFHDPDTYTGSLLLLAGINPLPWIGWTTSDGGTTWTDPTPPSPQDQAQASLQGLFSQVPQMAQQIQTDAALFASTPVGSTLTAEHLAALQRVVNGFSTVLSAIQDHATFTGAIQ